MTKLLELTSDKFVRISLLNKTCKYHKHVYRRAYFLQHSKIQLKNPKDYLLMNQGDNHFRVRMQKYVTLAALYYVIVTS